MSARPLDAGAAAATVVLCLSWGLNQVAIKLAMADIPPLIQAGIRSTGALVLISAWMLARRVPLFGRDGTLKPGLLAGTLFGCEFALVYAGLQFTTASRSALFLYTAPFFIALGAPGSCRASICGACTGWGSRCRSPASPSRSGRRPRSVALAPSWVTSC